MENLKETRRNQRFENFTKAFQNLKQAIDRINELDDLGKEGLIQRFEYTFELAWKLLKDHLESEGLSVKSPRECLKTAFSSGIIDNGELWLEMLEDRNFMAHTYDETNFSIALDNILNKYFTEIENLYEFFIKQQ